ncbi:MAG TPA: arylsulfatase [Planctomycetota bacterium]|nr:arylsulfatase [Planctomycetota bacterium]
MSTLILPLALALSALTGALGSESSARPNLVVIMADDMGYSDIGCFGGEIATPNLDRLAANGVRLTQFYNTGRCCPTRASLLTGRYAHQAGVGWMTSESGQRGQDFGYPAYTGELNRTSLTFAEVLAAAGYRTLMAGKWHVGTFSGMWPLDRGFERFYGLIRGASNHFQPHPDKLLVEGRRPVSPGEDFYSSDSFTDAAVSFVRESRERSEDPFLLYLAFTAPHWPVHAPAEDIERYQGKYDTGWEPVREGRFERMKQLGILHADCELSPLDVKPWSQTNPERRSALAHRMAIYAAMVDRLDQNVGRLIETLEELGELDDTLILFFADNGGCAEGGLMGGSPDEMVGGREGYFLTYGKGWANASNTPFRMYKHWVHEGGIASPFIAHWPSGIEARGTIQPEPCHLIDVAATLFDLAGARYPERHGGNEIGPLEGISLLPLFRGEELERPSPIFFEHEGNRAVREGQWKLVARHARPWELYDLSADRSETTDLADSQPERVASLSAAYEAWAERCGVLSWPLERREGFTPPQYPYPLTAPQLEDADGVRER